MSEILTEKWLTIVLFGGLIFAVLLILGLQRGQKKIFIAAGVVLAITAALLLVERLIVTQREQVQRSLNGIESAVNQHDLEKLLTYIHSSANSIRDKATYYYKAYNVQEANITQVKKFTPLSKDEAQVVFVVALTGSGEGASRSGPIAVQANFKKENGTYKVTKYRWDSVEKAFTNRGFGDEVDFPVDDY